MAENLESRDEHLHEEAIPTVTIALVTGILSLMFSLATISTNSLLLLILYKDPFKYFRPRATTFFVASLSLSDFLGGFLVQPLYSVYMLGIARGNERKEVYDVSSVISHANTKISILTVVALSVDRYLAVKLSWKYKALVTVRRVITLNCFIWILCGTFEMAHTLNHPSEKLFHAVDLHLQTTVPVTILCAVYIGTYLEFRRYSRNVVFVRTNLAGRSRTYVRNIRLEKTIVLTIALIIIVLFISLMPFLIVTQLEQDCHGDHNDECDELGFAFLIAKSLSVPMLCVSCVANPFLYAWKIPQYRQALRSVWRSIRSHWRRRMLRTTSPALFNFQSVVATGSVIEQNTPDGTSHIKQKEQEKNRASTASDGIDK